MKRALFIAISILLVTSTALSAQNAIAHAAVTFKIKNLGIYTNGTLGGLQAIVHFNPDDLSSANIDASADANTISTDNSFRDGHIKSDEFFDVAHFPKISLKSISIKHKDGNNYEGQFNLTIKNKTLPIIIPFTFTQKDGLMVFSGSFTINRRDYGVGGATLTLSDKVIISIEGEIHS